MELDKIAKNLVEQAKAKGARGVIVALSQDEIVEGVPKHSSYWVEHSGPCLEVEGLLQRIKHVVSKIWVK